MFQTHRFSTLLCLSILGASFASLPAVKAESAAQRRDKHERKIEKRLAHFQPGTYLQIDFRDSTEAYGSLGSLTDASFQFTNADTNTTETHSYGDVDGVKRAKEYIGKGSMREHHMRMWVPLVVGAAAAGGAVAAYEMTR